MIVEKIKNILGQDKRKNLIFYFDADESFKDELQEIAKKILIPKEEKVIKKEKIEESDFDIEERIP